jgi:signal transduction histidine kinase
MAGAVALVVVPTILLNNCWCDSARLGWRAGLVALIGLAWALELTYSRLPKTLFGALVAVPVGWLIFTDNGSVVALFLLLAAGWVMYTGMPREGLITGGLGVLAVLGYAHFDSPDRWLPWIMGIGATTLMMYLFVAQRRLVVELRTAQADLARQAVAAERRRIAYEIHDVAAHSLGVTLLYLTGARLRLLRHGGDPDLVETLAEVERLGRQSLDDVRRTVGLLQESPVGATPPQPAATDIERLVEQYCTAGLDVCLQVTGEPTSLPPATGLALFRIVQEALANVVKHAPGATVQVKLEVAFGARLRVCNSLPNAVGAISTRGSGLGLGSMAERARLLDGWLKAGPDGVGWLVECAIPGRP